MNRKLITAIVSIALLGAGVVYASDGVSKASLNYDIGQLEGAQLELTHENDLDRRLKAELILQNQAELQTIIERQNGEVNVIDNRIADRSFRWREYNGLLLSKKAQLESLGNK